MRIALLGLGLIGGSIVRALKEDPARAGAFADTPLTLVAWLPSDVTAKSDGDASSVDQVARTIAEAVDGASLVVLCMPAMAIPAVLDELVICRRSGRLLESAVIMDVASTKRWIIAEASKRGLRFCGSHPMTAVTEIAASEPDAGLFVGSPWVIVPGPHAGGGPALVERLATSCGARPIMMEAELYDAAVAAVSHLPLLLSVALVEAIATGLGSDDADGWGVSHLLASGAWDAVTKLARGSDQVGADILATNAREVRRKLTAMRLELERWDARLIAAENDPAAGSRDIQSRLNLARTYLEEHG